MTSDSSAPAIPALYFHCKNTYKAMFDRAQPNTGLEPGKTILVYEGMLTQLITGELRLSIPYYTMITKKLTAMGCIAQLRRGGGTAPSQWALFREPTQEDFLATDDGTASATANATKFAQLQSQITAVNARLGPLEQQVQKMLEAMNG